MCVENEHDDDDYDEQTGEKKQTWRNAKIVC